MRIVNVGQQGLQFIDQVSGSSTSTISVGTTIRWVWVGGGHTTTFGPCNDVTCAADGRWSSPEISEGAFEHTFAEAGQFPYFCAPHSEVLRGTVIVNP